MNLVVLRFYILVNMYIGTVVSEPLAFYNATIILVGMIYYAIRNHKLHYSLVLGWLLSLCGDDNAIK